MKNILYLVTVSILISNCGTNRLIKEKQHCITDKEMAIHFADSVFKQRYGVKVEKNKPYKFRIKNDSIWVIEGVLKQGKGGVPYIEFNMKNCEILKVIHGK